MAAARPDVGGGLMCTGLVQVTDHDSHILLGQLCGQCLTDTRCSAGDDGDLAREIHALCLPFRARRGKLWTALYI